MSKRGTGYECAGCLIDTNAIDEFYMVTPEI
jgi:hypothetical protein